MLWVADGAGIGPLATTVVVVLVVVVVLPSTHLPPTKIKPRSLEQVLQATPPSL